MSVKPHVLAVLLCDFVAPGINGKYNIMGTFNRFGAAKFPARLNSLGIFFMANSMPKQGTLSLQLKLEDTEIVIPLPHVRFENAPDDRKEIFQLGAQIHNIEIPQAGDYRLEVLWDGQMIHSQYVRIHQLDTGGPKNGKDN